MSILSGFVPKKSAGVSFWCDEELFKVVKHGFFCRDVHVSSSEVHDLEIFGDLCSVSLLRQVHGTRICSVMDRGGEGDGFFLETGDGFAGIKTADCTPVIILNKELSLASILHCGWRGTLDGIIFEAVKKFKDRGVSPSDLLALIGPAAQVCCYEVGRDLIDRVLVLEDLYRRQCGSDMTSAVKFTNNSNYFSVPFLIREQLLASGLEFEDISILDLCTICNKSFYSYRREGTMAGRQLSFLGMF